MSFGVRPVRTGRTRTRRHAATAPLPESVTSDAIEGREAAARRYPPGMPEVGRNPFQPGRGILPPLLAGRDAELSVADQALARLTEGRSPSEDLLFYGPRGNGKTTILLEIARRARERGLRVEALLPPALDGVEKLVRKLQERTGRRQGQVTGFQFMGVGATGVPAAPTEDFERLFVSWINAEPTRPLVIVLDEVQTLSPEVGRPFFSVVQHAKASAAPFLVLAAGTPDAPRRLLRCGTYNERGFEFLPVGRLTRQDTNAALSEPARMAGRPLAEDALALLAEESQDYPYFVQLLGSAAWQAAAGSDPSDSRIDLSAAQQGVTEFSSRSLQFYERRYQEAESRRVEPVLRPLAALLSEHGGSLPRAPLMKLLRRFASEDSIPFDDISLRQELSDLGVLWSVRPGYWEMGIPSFADFLLHHG